MAQGVRHNQDEVLELLQPYFQLGCSVTKACSYAGIPRTTIQTWIESDEAIRLKVTAWQNEISARAREVWAAQIEAGDYRAAERWLARKEIDEFGTEQLSLTGNNKQPIPILATLTVTDRHAVEQAFDEQ